MALLPLAPVPARAGQDVRAVDGLHRVLDLDADGQDDVGRRGEHGLDPGHQAESARPAGPLDPDARFPAQGRIDIGNEGREVALPVEPGGHEVADHALVHVRPAADLLQDALARLADVFLEARPRLLGVEFLAAGPEGYGLVAGRHIYLAVFLAHVRTS
jgi:hypothetical protein